MCFLKSPFEKNKLIVLGLENVLTLTLSRSNVTCNIRETTITGVVVNTSSQPSPLIRSLHSKSTQAQMMEVGGERRGLPSKCGRSSWL